MLEGVIKEVQATCIGLYVHFTQDSPIGDSVGIHDNEHDTMYS